MWNEYNREARLDEWDELRAPSTDQMVSVCLCIMRLREEPRDSMIAVPIAGGVAETWVADVPGSDPLVCILYNVFEDVHGIDYLMIDGID